MEQNRDTLEHKCNDFFEKADTSGDGNVSAVELYKYLYEIGYGKSTEDVAEMFCDLNTNKDDRISKDEFMSGLLKVSPKDVTKKQLMGVFKRFDADGSGFITRDELVTALQECNMDPEGCCLGDLDDNDDGKVNEDEFLHIFDQKVC